MGAEYGYTSEGQPVHARTVDHHPAETPYQRLNKRVALWLTAHVGTMSCFWAFAVLALCSLPAILHEFNTFRNVFPSWMVSASLIALIAWVSSNFLQLVLLPSLMVGQNLQNEAADVRASKTFDDVESVKTAVSTALDRLDTTTAGGLAEVLEAIQVSGKGGP